MPYSNRHNTTQSRYNRWERPNAHKSSDIVQRKSTQDPHLEFVQTRLEREQLVLEQSLIPFNEVTTNNPHSSDQIVVVDP